MNILHLSSEKTWRGGEQQIAYLIDELSAMGITIHVAARSGSAFETYCRKKNMEVFPLPFQNSFDFKTARALKEICRKKNIDLIHLHSAKSHTLSVLSVLFGNTTPLALSRRVDFVPKNSLFTKWKYNHQSIKKVLCVSDKINHIMQAYLKEPAKCITVHSGIDLSKFENSTRGNQLHTEFKINSNTILIGNTSALEDHKDYITFIDTIEVLSEKKLPIHAFIIGKGALEKSLKEYVNNKQLTTLITFTGFRNDVTAILPELDVFLMPSKEEGLGTSILDAFLAKVPVVATAAGGIPEMVIHEQSGMLAPIGDAAELARHIERIISDKDLRKSLVEGAVKKVKEFSKEATAVKTLEVYKAILAST